MPERTPGVSFRIMVLSACLGSLAGVDCSAPGDGKGGKASEPTNPAPSADLARVADQKEEAPLQLRLEISSMLPIGWGTKYRCRVEEIERGELRDLAGEITLAASVGSEKLAPDIHWLQVGGVYRMGFIETRRISETPYLPAGTTGFMDSRRMIWDLVFLERLPRR